MNPAAELEPKNSAPARADADAAERTLPSGRSVLMRLGEAGEELEVRNPDGDVELRITLTDAGPVVRLTGGRLEIVSPQSVHIDCGKLEVHTADGIDLQSAGPLQFGATEMYVTTEGDIRLKGGIIHLN